MEKTKLIKIFLVVLVSVMLVFVATSTYADDEPVQFVDVTNNSAAPSNTNSNNTNTNSNTNSNSNSNSNNTNTNSNTNLIANTSNSSNYNNNANLPKTGVAETGSVICIAFALAVSAGYAYKKLRDYNV